MSSTVDAVSKDFSEPTSSSYFVEYALSRVKRGDMRQHTEIHTKRCAPKGDAQQRDTNRNTKSRKSESHGQDLRRQPHVRARAARPRERIRESEWSLPYLLSLCCGSLLSRSFCVCHEQFGKVEQCAVKHGFAFIHFQEARDAEVCSTLSVWCMRELVLGLMGVCWLCIAGGSAGDGQPGLARAPHESGVRHLDGRRCRSTSVR